MVHNFPYLPNNVVWTHWTWTPVNFFFV